MDPGLRTLVVLAMHGTPPNDFPGEELGEYFALHAQVEAGSPPAALPRYRELEAKVRKWPRDARNDPFHAGSLGLASEMERALGTRVIVGFNEFCAPDIRQALDQAVAGGAERVVVVTPMLTRGGGHAEVDIPAAIERARRDHPGVTFEYVWPVPEGEVAAFLVAQIEKRRTSGRSRGTG